MEFVFVAAAVAVAGYFAYRYRAEIVGFFQRMF
jgi:hypothetical protein